MTSFHKKELDPPKRVCLRLKECREARGISLAELAKRTRISQKYLEAIESCRFDDIPFAAIYQKNFIKRFASALSLPPHEFLDQYNQEEVRGADAPQTPTARRDARHLSNLPLILRRTVLGAAVVLAIAYLGLQVKQSIDPPMLALFSPVNGSVVATREVSVHGSTKEGVQIFINGEAVILNQNGEFKEKIYLAPGINTIVVSAKRKHGKTTVETRHVILKNGEELSRS